MITVPVSFYTKVEITPVAAAMPSSAVHVDGWYSIHINKDIKSYISNVRILKEIKEGQVTDLGLFVVAEIN